ncbi:MAG: hypothetical protein K6G61_09945 [Solobacterium sp.]|nr:hypothetical protein [Solobacterium sp.]
MIRIAICCGEGFASGYLARHLAQTAIKENLQDEVCFIFIPFFQLYDRQDEVDIAMCMQHVDVHIKRDTRPYKIPIYIIVFKVAIKPSAREYFEDAEDILKLANGRGGLIGFPDEDQPQFVSRLVSHRKWLQSNQNNSSKKKKA